MSADPRKRQKKQERRAAKRKEKKHLQVRQQSAGLPERLSTASKYPILHCWISDSPEEQGMNTVLLSRELPGGQVAVATFLVDRFCLGVKDAFARILGRASYNERYVREMRKKLRMQDAAPADARKLVEDAVAYAHSIGIAPYPDYLKVVPLFGSVNAADSTTHFEFGKDGKPFFFAGPHDSPERCRQIMAILTNTCGPDGYHFTIPLTGRETFAPGELELVDDDEEYYDEDE